MTDLTALFDCPRFGPLTHRACLRRQVERKEPTKRGLQGPPVREYCGSGDCETGRAVRGAHGALSLEACSRCGSALFGGEACPTCAARKADEGKAVPRGVLPAHVVNRGGVTSSRIWTEKQPDVPFIPPREQRRAVDAIAAEANLKDGIHQEGERHAMSAGKAGAPPEPGPAVSTTPAPIHPQSPASPAEEKPMAGRAPKKCCGSRGPRCKAGCDATAPKSTKKRMTLEEVAAVRAPADLVVVDPTPVNFDARGRTIGELAQIIERCRTEARRLREDALAVQRKAEEVLGYDATPKAEAA